MNDPVLTLRWFLNCPEIDNLEFFGDEDCLGNPITGVNVIDNPEGALNARWTCQRIILPGHL